MRSGEVRQARWSWVSFHGVPTLTIPGEVMKGRKSEDVKPHRVPLSPAALEVFALAYRHATATTATAAQLPDLAALRGDALIFPSIKRGVPLSDMSLSAVLRRMNADRPEAVPHGFRGTFRIWVDDTRPDEDVAAEKALAHEVGNAVSGRYRHSDPFRPASCADGRVGDALHHHREGPGEPCRSARTEGEGRAVKGGGHLLVVVPSRAFRPRLSRKR